MLELFNMGGPLFMGLLTLTAIAGLVVFVRSWLQSETLSNEVLSGKIDNLKSIGTFAFVLGVLGQLIGLYDAFTAIEQVGAISPSILVAGIRLSSITSIYGMMIFLITYLFSFVLGTKIAS